MSLIESCIAEYVSRFGTQPAFVVRAPGRVNLIGEHTDYNDGFVMPLAIDRHTVIALSPLDNDRMMMHSVEHAEQLDVDLNALTRDKMSWREYPKGVAKALQDAGYALTGWQGVTNCDVPMGAGLSSSASYELAIAQAFSVTSGFPWDPAKMAQLTQKAENEWVGVNCGIMDQMISASGREGHAVLIDCRDLATHAVPLPDDTAIVILDTATRRGLVDSAYNERREQCEAASTFFGVKVLRDVSLETFEARGETLDAVVRRRARHVITENARTEEAAKAMEQGDAERLGQLMNASHDSLRDDFEVTNDELNTIVDIAREQSGCLGARMTGAGFGGCAVALVRSKKLDKFINSVCDTYTTKTALSPNIYTCKASEGAHEVALHESVIAS
jgi:galactokinase